MSREAYEQFLDLEIGTIFTSTAEWGERDVFIKVDNDHYRRTYDYITFPASHDMADEEDWPGIRTMTVDEIPKWISHNPPLTDEQCREMEGYDQKRLKEYVEETGELPEMGWL